MVGGLEGFVSERIGFEEAHLASARWRLASYRSTAVATAELRDSTPVVGMATSSAMPCSSLLTPRPSLPAMMAQVRTKSVAPANFCVPV